MYERTKFHENKIAGVHKISRGKKLHEDNFARVTFLHESKKTKRKKNTDRG